MQDKKIVIVGSGVSGVNFATTMVDNGYPGELITIIDMGKSPYKRKPSEVMEGFLGAGGWSDGKIIVDTNIGGHMSKYCGGERAMEVMQRVLDNFTRFHPDPSKIQNTNPKTEPDFIKPHFGLRLFPVSHVGTDYLSEIGKNWYDYLVSKRVQFIWGTKVTDIHFDNNKVYHEDYTAGPLEYDTLIFGVGKSGIDFANNLQRENKLPTESKPVQIGVRFEAPQKYFQKLIDISYDFKLYRKPNDKVSLRTFCTNNNAAYVAVEETYGDHSYNGHAKKDKNYKNGMTNFGIIMEIKGIKEPFDWAREAVKKLQLHGTGLFFSPYYSRVPSKTSEGEYVSCEQIGSLDILYDALGDYAFYIEDFVEDLRKVFPELGSDWGMYIPEVKYLNDEVIVNYENLSLVDYPNVHFIGDALSARGIAVSGAQGNYVADFLLNKK